MRIDELERPRRGKRSLFLLALLACLGASTHGASPEYLGKHRANSADTQAIEKLLNTYTASVTHGDKKSFEALLLNDDIPFSSTDELVAPHAEGEVVDTHRYSRFRKAVFESGVQYSQQFFNVHIEQDGDLAQVSLDFVTTRVKTGKSSFGWKTLQLLKLQGQWKIVSELYTVRDTAAAHVASRHSHFPRHDHRQCWRDLRDFPAGRRRHPGQRSEKS